MLSISIEFKYNTLVLYWTCGVKLVRAEWLDVLGLVVIMRMFYEPQNVFYRVH